MKHVTISKLNQLIGIRADPAISIYVGAGAGTRTRLEALRDQLSRAADLLASKLSRREIDDLLLPIARSAGGSGRAGSGCALLRSASVSEAFAVRGDVPDLAIVAPAFHTKPLVQMLDGGERFVLLALGDGAVAPYQGDARRVARMDLALPSRGRVTDADVDEWYQAVDHALRAALWDHGDPVVLAGTIERRSRFAAVSRYPWILDAGVECDLDQVQVPDLHAEAFAIVAAERADVEAAAVIQYASAHRVRRASDDLSEIARAAVTGRVPLLLHRRGAHVWGTVDPLTGECRLSPRVRPRFGEGDIIDDLTQLVLRADGDVVEVAPDAMPSTAPVAAVVAPPASRRKRPSRPELGTAVA